MSKTAIKKNRRPQVPARAARAARVREDMISIPRAEYERLLALDTPALPQADERGHIPAIEYARASIARDLIRRRTAARLSQDELADQAGVRRETVSRIESGKHTTTPRIMEKIDRALRRLEGR